MSERARAFLSNALSEGFSGRALCKQPGRRSRLDDDNFMGDVDPDLLGRKSGGKRESKAGKRRAGRQREEGLIMEPITLIELPDPDQLTVVDQIELLDEEAPTAENSIIETPNITDFNVPSATSLGVENVQESVILAEPVVVDASKFGAAWNAWFLRTKGSQAKPSEKLFGQWADLTESLAKLTLDDRARSLMAMYRAMLVDRPNRHEHQMRQRFYDQLDRTTRPYGYLDEYRQVPGAIVGGNKNYSVANPVYFLVAYEVLSRMDDDQRMEFRAFVRDEFRHMQTETLHVTAVVSRWIEQNQAQGEHPI